eukprot:3576707-Karenia_brevis.AAC.1
MAGKYRKAYDGLQEVDKDILQASLRGRTEEEKSIIRAQVTAARWTNEQKHELDIIDDSRCELCGEVEADRCHMFWDCTAIKCRLSETYIKHINKDDLT